MEITKIRLFRKYLRKFERLVNKQLKENDCCKGVSMAQCHVLLEIEDQGQTTTAELTKLLSLDKSTLSRTVDELVKTGLVERIPHPTDGRFNLLTLTKIGKAACNNFNKANDDYYDEVFKHIPTGKQETIIENFSVLVQAFTEMGNNPKNNCCNSKNKNRIQ